MRIKKLIKKFIPDFLLSFYHYLLVLTGAFFYGFPGKSKKIKIIGITGTSGKSTVVMMASQILEQAGYKIASISSIKFKIGDKQWENKLKMTMPGRFKIQKFLNQAIKEKCQYAVLEVTSEGIKQHRHRFIDFDTAVFTNLSPEHIESHNGFENYRNEKLKLFNIARNVHIINIDDKNAEHFLNVPAKKKIGFTANRQSLIVNRNLEILEAENIELKENYSLFIIHNSLFKIQLLGRFNIYNAMAAICVGVSQGVSLDVCKSALEKIKQVPGRMEIVIGEPFKIIVDYAHTPESLEKVYKTIKGSKFQVPSSTICVLGACGGGRDKWKRSVLGKIAAHYCDEIILTNEDPYDEDPSRILSEIKSGAPALKPNLYEILDRRGAIRKALELAKLNDIVVITGKGSESWMCVENGKKIPWDDRQIVKEEFNKLKR